MSQDEEAKLALLRESLSNNKSNAPIIINFNSFNAPVGQHNEHVDTVNFSRITGRYLDPLVFIFSLMLQ